MILEKLDNIKSCFNENTLLSKAAEFALSFNPDSPTGRYEVDGERIYAIYTHNTTQEASEKEFETHQKYIDIQLLYSGELIMGHTFGAGTESTSEYNTKNDIQMFSKPKEYSKVAMTGGEFVVFFPHDYHMPDCCVTKPSGIKKLIIKVHV